MRIQVLAGLLLVLASGAQAQDGPPAPAGGRPRGLFVSPMGEPFRGTPDGKAPQDAWFDGADANHDGALTLDEFRDDAMRWFKVLDRKGDGEIDPADIEVYETVLAPEARGGGFEMGGPTMGDNGEVKAAEIGSTRVLSGLARFNYLGSPEPVTAADSSLNGGVTPVEFLGAAKRRFDLLDTNHDGKITKAELPELRSGPMKRRGGRGGGGEGGGRRGGGGNRGGYMGGSMGGSMGG
ncbi:EF-hand domain-containing protein [Sphingomonas pituitosa]|uniref:EF-hand domain-containing protein n=1 Tax=Sphingomonas pituitosa TaxID=99597 RepID=UPI000831B32C|nr:EF-hand domain-containing protein [Sphingomonas pituitosa]